MEINTVLFKALSENELVSITKKIFGESAVLKKYELLKGGLFKYITDALNELISLNFVKWFTFL